MSKTRIPARLRREIQAQAGHRCGYCRSSEAITSVPLVVDHIVPEAAGGPTVQENLWLACVRCNQFKADRTHAQDPLTGELVALFNRRTQVWKEHFTWSADGAEIVSLTPGGRATVVALRLNRELAVLARGQWVSVGW
ncbi:MAG: HNH endonuclease [Anaerolineae bacterium]